MGILILLVHSLWLCIFTSSISFADTVKVSSSEYAPFVTYQNNKTGGIVSDIVKESYKAKGMDSQIYITPFPRAVKEVLSGKSAAGFFDRETLVQASEFRNKTQA